MGAKISTFLVGAAYLTFSMQAFAQQPEPTVETTMNWISGKFSKNYCGSSTKTLSLSGLGGGRYQFMYVSNGNAAKQTSKTAFTPSQITSVSKKTGRSGSAYVVVYFSEEVTTLTKFDFHRYYDDKIETNETYSLDVYTCGESLQDRIYKAFTHAKNKAASDEPF